MTILVKKPSKCSTDELASFRNFVARGGEVTTTGLERRIRQAEALAFLYEKRQLAGIAALKNPNASYRKDVFQKAEAKCSADDYPYELGWIYVEKEQRGKGFSVRLVEAIMQKAGKRDVYATSRTDNEPMHRSLHRASFKEEGKPYLARDGNHHLSLFIRESA